MSESVPSPRQRAIQDIVRAALQADPADRESFVREASSGDPGLADEALQMLRELLPPDQLHLRGSDEPDSWRSLLRVDPRGVAPGGAGDEPTFAAIAGGPVQGGTGDDFSGTARFEIRRRLGAGGFGTVYECYDRQQQSLVAVKVLRRAEFVDRFKRELRALVDVRHPNLVELYELFCEGSTWFFTMELIHGSSLLQYLQHEPRPAEHPQAAACSIGHLLQAALQLAQGIRALHERGILHRDIKPGNVLVTADGRVRLLDFGLVRESDRSAINGISLAGTPPYMAPEVLAGEPAGEASDWYSFGVVLYVAMVGALPTDLVRRAPRAAAFAADVPAHLRDLCADLLQPEARQRPTGSEVMRRLGVQVIPAAGTRDSIDDETLIGRETQLRQLQDLLQAAKKGRSVVANVHGHSGVGKSTLLRTFRRRVEHDDPHVVVLAGRCYQNETIPYKALDDLVDWLGQYLRTLPDWEAEALAPHDVQCLIRIFPVLSRVEGLTRARRRTAEILDAQELRERAFASLQDLVSRLSERRVVVIAIDDLQWGDLDSAAFLKRLLVTAAPPSWLFIASYRSDDVETSPFLQSWRALLSASTKLDQHDVALRPLTASEAKALAISLIGQTGLPGDQRAEVIAQESGGSPFLIDQFARHWQLETGRPGLATIGQIVEEQLSALPLHIRQLLEVIAVAGQPIACGAANAAVGLPRDSHAELAHLVVERFVRIRDTRGPRQVELYHDRVRDGVVASMPAERRQARHLALAHALEREEPAEPPLIATHFHRAGEQQAAARYSIIAGEEASAALAFDRAAQWYRLALESGGARQGLRRKLADALARGGQSVEAADVYRTAADEAPEADRFELQRLGAEQLLRIGRVNDGLALLHASAKDMGVWIPTQRWQMMASLLWHRLRIACRQLERPVASPADASRQSVAVLDVHWSLVVGLATQDVARSAEFQARHLLLALRVGDRSRLAMALAAEAAQRATSPRRDLRTITSLFAKADELAAGTTHPQAAGLIATMKALAALLCGDWRGAEELADKADTILREQCTGVTWELATASMVKTSAAHFIGDFRALEETYSRLNLMDRATEQNDAYAVQTLALGFFVFHLADDRPARCAQLVESFEVALFASRGQGYVLPRLWLLELRVDTALYEGRPDQAWAFVSSDWKALSSSLHFRVEYAAIIAHDLRARTAIATARSASSGKELYLRQAIRSAQALERFEIGWARLLATIVRAGVASVEGRRSDALELLARAEPLARDASMHMHLAACQYRRGSLTAGASGEELLSEAEAWLREQKIVNPSRYFDVHLPGDWA